MFFFVRVLIAVVVMVLFFCCLWSVINGIFWVLFVSFVFDFAVFINFIGKFKIRVGFGIFLFNNFSKWNSVVGVLLIVIIELWIRGFYNFIVVVEWVLLICCIIFSIFGLLRV